MWRENELMWSKTQKENLVHASVLHKKLEEEAQKILLEDHQRLYRMAQAAVARNTSAVMNAEGKLNCRFFPEADSLFKSEKIVDDEPLEEKTGNKSASSSPFSFSRIRRTDERRFVHHLQEKSSKMTKSVSTEDKFTTIDDFDDNSIDEDRLVTVNARLRFPGE